MSENCNHDCSSCGSNCGDRSKPQSFLEAPHPASKVKKVIGVVSGKGGVGKSLVTSLLAAGMQRKGYQSGILDADITGPSIPKAFGIQDKAEHNGEGLLPARSAYGTQIMSVNLLLDNETDPVVWRGPVIAGVVKQFWTDVIWSDVDYLFVDMPPGTGDVPLTVFQSLPIDGIIIVTSPQELVGMIVEKAVNMAAMMDVPVLGLVENMSYFECPNCKEKHFIFGESKAQEMALIHDIPQVCMLPIKEEIATLVDHGMIESYEEAAMQPLLEAMEKLLEK